MNINGQTVRFYRLNRVVTEDQRKRKKNRKRSRREEQGHHLAIERSLGSIHRFSIPPIIYRILLLHLSDWERIRQWVWIRWDILKQVFIRFAFFCWLVARMGIALPAVDGEHKPIR